MEEQRTTSKKVMVAIDETDISRYALEWALENLRDTIDKSGLVIFTVQPIADFGYIYTSTLGSAPAELIQSVQENQKKAALALLDRAKEICSNYGIVPETATEIGDPKDVICKAVEKFNVKLLVLGSHGRGAIQRVFLGSVSNYCVQNVKCPVLVVKRKA